ncbi:unnamed protein product [Aureobasidium pullulans]|nr:unnamed protein product [Aureobasidium pullulans]
MANTMSDVANKAAWLTEAKANPSRLTMLPCLSLAQMRSLSRMQPWQSTQSIGRSKTMASLFKTSQTYWALTSLEKSTMLDQMSRTSRRVTEFYPCPEILTSKIPEQVSYTDAVVLPLAISTASAGLYQRATSSCPTRLPSPKSSGKVILIWGGSSSVGSTAIQLAVASGVQVITTASKHNHDYCSKLGAKAVIDYNSSSVADDIVAVIKDTGAEFAGIYDSISLPETFKHCFEVLQKAGGSKNMATVLPPPEDKPSDLNVQGVFAITIANQHKEVGDAVWQKFVPGAIQSGDLKCLPEPLVVGKGLDSVQKGLDKSKAGVSAKKVVIEL